MSRDQKPGRIRVIAGGRRPEANAVAVTAPAASAAVPAADGTGAEKGSGFRWSAALIFLGGCAAGGAGFIALSNGF